MRSPVPAPPGVAALAVTTLLSLAEGAVGQQPPAGSDFEGDAFEITRVEEGVYHAVGTGALAVGANAAIVVNENDVLLVDSHVSPAAAWALLGELQSVTTKPVRFVVNTHFHFDHAHGNQVYPADVQIIGHEFTRATIASGGSVSGRAYGAFIGTLPERIAELRAERTAATDSTRRSELDRMIAFQENYLRGVGAVQPTPPNMTLSRRLTIYRDGREIGLYFFGRGHTGGDVVVHLPRERILVTGDLVTEGLPYMGDGYLLEWVDTLEELKGLEFDWIVPGHGRPFQERERIDHLQAYLRDLWERAERMYRDGVGAEEASRRIDMRDHAEHYPQIRESGVNPHAVLRVYELLEGGSG